MIHALRAPSDQSRFTESECPGANARPLRSVSGTVRAEKITMAKVEQGRLDGVWGMRRFSAAELYALADDYERAISDSENTDDPKWLQRLADRIRRLAYQKEKALRHKAAQFQEVRREHAILGAGCE